MARTPKLFLAFATVSSIAFATASAEASCGERPGTPNEVMAQSTSATSIRLSWKNTTGRKNYNPVTIRPQSHSMWFDIAVTDQNGRALADKGATGIAPEGRIIYGSRSSHEITGLNSGTEYRFQVRARTEGGHAGCVSQKWSAWAVARTPTTH